MTRDPLHRAADEVDAARAATDDAAVADRLGTLAGQLRSQADRDATPALGTLDRVHAKLRDLEDRTGDPEGIASAREEIMAFLGTLEDRGMTQWPRGAADDP